MQHLRPSELIINPDGSIYHLNLLPGEVAETIITVGDQDRVGEVSKHFDVIEVKKQKREFLTHTGRIGSHRITVISTGIGPDNIDIVFNELDALFNIDFDSRLPKEELTALDFIRIGTSGALRADLPVDSLLLSTYGLGMDNLGDYYLYAEQAGESALVRAWDDAWPRVYATTCDPALLTQINSDGMRVGMTLTAPGFYAPQGRMLRLAPRYRAADFLRMAVFTFEGMGVTNLEMETAAIYRMSRLLGHRALSTNAILANRATGAFSQQPKVTVERLIQHVLTRITAN